MKEIWGDRKLYSSHSLKVMEKIHMIQYYVTFSWFCYFTYWIFSLPQTYPVTLGEPTEFYQLFTLLLGGVNDLPLYYPH